ncbi:ribonuclease Z [Exophiala viscosa]|uniref:ribonuclease Z n=1 Tax=Exophiala viscosa TaxID=2486360 RepID=UPI0021925040|nr:ribonuclease Z [Exophiala viscosa]
MQDRKQGAKSVGVRTNFHLQFITTFTSDTPGTSLILHFDNKRYIFGELCEGTQRACISRGIGLRKVRGVFLSGKTAWSNGGLIGLILTMADVQHGEVESEGSTRRPRLNIYGGPKQQHSLACARRFVFRTGMPLSVHEINVQKSAEEPTLVHEDENIRVWAISAESVTSTAAEPEDQYESDADVEPERTDIDESRVSADQSLRKHIVNNMFDSDWKRDRLVECKLKDIKLPALVWVRDPETKTLTSYTCVGPDNIGPLTMETDVLVRTPWPASEVQELPEASGLPTKVATSYIIKGHAQRGTFDPAKAASLGLKPGPLYARLVAGDTVENDAGQTISPDMVLTPTRPGRGVAIFDVPSVRYLASLEQRLEACNDQLFDGLEAAIWITRGSVPYSDRFRQLLGMHKDIKHVVSHPDLCKDYITQDSFSISSIRLNNVASEFFAVPRYDNTHAYRPVAATASQDIRELLAIKDSGIDVLPAKRGLRIHVEPTFALDETEVPGTLDLASLNMPIEERVRECLPEDMSPYRRTQPASLALDLDEPEIVTLGTGSAAPSKYRNVSAVLLRMPNKMGTYLFDCGEGTLGQLQRLYTPEQMDELLFNLKAIWISHLHADHHLGTISILQAAVSAGKRLSGPDRPQPAPPCLISEINMMDYMNDYHSVLGVSTETLCTPVACHWTEGMSLRGKPFDFSQTDVPIKDLRTVKVNHCHGAQAISVTFSNGFKFSYSGDCRPNEAFCTIGADSDVLVHEATFDDGLDGDARAKKHCTTGEAVGVALKMRAKNLILTHFSQRYQKLPVLSSVKMPEHNQEDELDDDVDGEMATGPTTISEDAPVQSTDASAWVEHDSTRDLNIGVAFDLMRIKISQIASFKKLLPAISKMFEIEEEKRDQQRREAAAVVQAEQDRKMADKLARQEANRKKFQEATGKKKKDTRNKRKLDDGTNKPTADTNAKATENGSATDPMSVAAITHPMDVDTDR